MYIVLDIETTGLSRFKHGITEIAAQKFDGTQVVDEFQTLINPERHIPSMITRLTGINNDMVADAPLIKEIFPKFLDFIKDDTIVAHNASFDYNFLDYHCRQSFSYGIGNQVLCTRKLANRLLPELPSKRLEMLCQHFKIINERAHRAMYDTQVTTQILKNFLTILAEKGIENKEDILLFQSSKICYY